jgi:phosphoglycerate kinase
MAKKTVADVDVKGKRVLMRVDFNVPLDGDKITDDRRIEQALPTIKSVIERGGRLILMSHLGRPKGGPEPKYSLKPAAKRLSELLDKPVAFAPDCIGPEVEKMAAAVKDGEVLLLENLRFHKGEEKNEPKFAEQLAKLGDVYVNDAFGTAHREHASTFGVPQLLQGKPRVIGFLIQKELKFLGDAITPPSARSSRSSAARRFRQDQRHRAAPRQGRPALIGGAMAYTFFLGQNKQVGKSLVERDKVDLARELLAKAKGKIRLPVDNVISNEMTDTAKTSTVEGDIPADMEGFDIGPKTRDLYKAEIAKAKTVVWNGRWACSRRSRLRRARGRSPRPSPTQRRMAAP